MSSSRRRPDGSSMPYMRELFLSFMRKHRTMLLWYVAAMLLITFERIVVPHIYGKLLNAVRGAKYAIVWRFFITLVVIYAVFQGIDTGLTLLNARLAPAFESYVREEVVQEVIDRHRNHYAELDLGNITSKLIKLPAYLRDVFYRARTFLFNHVLAVIVTAGYLFYCHPMLGTIFTACFGLMALASWLFCSRCGRKSYAREDAFDRTQEGIQDVLSNLLSVYSSQTEERERRALRAMDRNLEDRIRDGLYCGVPFRIVFSILFLALFAGITGGGLYLHRTGRIKLEVLVSSFIVTFAMLKTCMGVYWDFDSLIFLRGGVQVVDDYLRSMPAACDSGGRGTTHADAGGGAQIEFRNVHFAYGRTAAASSKPAVSGLSFVVPPRQRVAIVGSIGSGKSTVAQLLMRLRCQQSGTILLNGVNVAALDTGALRRAVRYVPQHPRLFNRTLWDNLQYGNPALTPDHVHRTLQRLELRELDVVIRARMFRPVGKQGDRLSGGQRQLVWLMRALFSSSDVLVLDEPTASLDTHTREQVVRLITGLLGARTVILITHDPSLLTFVDRVIRLEHGVMVADDMRE